MSALWIILGIVAVIILALISIYNGLVSKRQRCNQAFADIDVQLKQRQNLIPNLVETVKGYASHEQETFQQVIAARNSAQSASTPGEMAQAEGMLTGALGKLFALAEAYPDLKATWLNRCRFLWLPAARFLRCRRRPGNSQRCSRCRFWELDTQISAFKTPANVPGFFVFCNGYWYLTFSN